MAYTATLNKTTVFGDVRVQMYTVTADAASGSVNTGLGSLFGLSWTPSSLTSNAANKIYLNALGGGTATAGYVGFGSFTTGDTGYLIVYGR